MNLLSRSITGTASPRRHPGSGLPNEDTR
uniref:Uncharacterized protein n=1 Tax=Arundo donax TaxID=35708 RepID=A0A0A9DL90_ARUDO